ncbi:MAG: carboxypeptidase regulatory-like domain-containing protein [Deltaproteobacteria bacterium]
MAKLAKILAAAAALTSGVAFGQSYTTSAVSNGGTVSGKVTFQGTPPHLAPEKRNKDPKVCGTTAPNQTLIVGADKGIKNVIVYLKDIKSGKAMALKPATLDQKKCSYDPHVQAVPVGTTMTVVNSDTVLHNVHASLGASTVFNYAMPIHNQKIPKKLTKAGFVKIKCDVHGWMNGAIGVMPNPYFAVTGDDGTFTISDVPAGSYTVEAWQETLGTQTQSVNVTGGGTATADFHFSKGSASN